MSNVIDFQKAHRKPCDHREKLRQRYGHGNPAKVAEHIRLRELIGFPGGIIKWRSKNPACMYSAWIWSSMQEDLGEKNAEVFKHVLGHMLQEFEVYDQGKTVLLYFKQEDSYGVPVRIALEDFDNTWTASASRDRSEPLHEAGMTLHGHYKETEVVHVFQRALGKRLQKSFRFPEGGLGLLFEDVYLGVEDNPDRAVQRFELLD